MIHGEFPTSTHLKLANVLAGIMGHGCLHHCTWSDISRDDLHLGKYSICISIPNKKRSRMINFEEQSFKYKRSNTVKLSS